MTCRRFLASLPRAALVVCLAGIGLAMATSSRAQSYPTRPIRIVVPFAPGGGSDVVGRVLAQKLSERLGQSVVVENKTGAGGSIGAGQVARAAPDGYTLLLGSSSEIAQYPNVTANVPYDPVRDFAPIGLVANVPLVLAVNDKLPVQSVQDLLKYARSHPGELNYGSAGTGSTTHLAMELFLSMTQVKMTHVPYKGSAPVVSDLLSGNLQLAMPTMSAVLPQIGSGKIRVLAVSTAARASALPDVATIKESGVPGYDIGLWTGLLAPAHTPAAIITQLNQAIAGILALPEVRETLARQGAEPLAGTPDQFAALIKTELGTWNTVVKQSGIQLE